MILLKNPVDRIVLTKTLAERSIRYLMNPGRPIMREYLFTSSCRAQIETSVEKIALCMGQNKPRFPKLLTAFHAGDQRGTPLSLP